MTTATRVFKLDELATLIATHLAAISLQSTVALARTCRALEVPALSVLWENQPLMHILFTHVLPADACYYTSQVETDLYQIVLQRPLTVRELNRLKRYASWMRRVYVREWNFSEGITRFFVPTSSNSHPFLRFTLRELCWWLNETNFSFVSTFLSPHLTKIDINTNLLEKPYETVDPWCEKIPTEVVPTMRSVIKMFPSSVQFLGIYLGNGQETRLTEEISAFILGCGESLRQFHSNLVLSTEAVVHLMNLPNLLNWTTEQGPPHVADLIRHGVPDGATSLFPSLEVLSLQGEAALEWLSILKTAKDGDLPWTMARNCLPCFRYVHSNFTIIDPTLFSRLLPLTDLVQITIGVGCLIGGSTCESRYSDQDVEGLAIALPRLEILMLGQWPCAANTCPTTIFSLLFLSVHCTNLKHLSIHFRTTDMLTDVMAMVDYAHSHDLHRRPKCALETLVTGEQIPQLEDYESELVAMGLAVIFPSLTLLKGSVGWGRLERMVALFGMVWSRKDLVETIMSLRGVGLLMEHELAVSPIEHAARWLHERLAPIREEVGVGGWTIFW